MIPGNQKKSDHERHRGTCLPSRWRMRPGDSLLASPYPLKKIATVGMVGKSLSKIPGKSVNHGKSIVHQAYSEVILKSLASKKLIYEMRGGRCFVFNGDLQVKLIKQFLPKELCWIFVCQCCKEGPTCWRAHELATVSLPTESRRNLSFCQEEA